MLGLLLPSAAHPAARTAGVLWARISLSMSASPSVDSGLCYARPASSSCNPRLKGVKPTDSHRCCESLSGPARGRGALATINSVIANAACPERLLFHVPSLDAENRARWATSMQDTFENVHLYQYSKVRACCG